MSAEGGQLNSSSLRELARYSGDPWQPSNEYFDRAEAHMEKLWSDRIWPFVRGCDFSSTVDLAAGKGRNSLKLIELCQALYVVDINEALVDHCRGRCSGSIKHNLCHRQWVLHGPGARFLGHSCLLFRCDGAL